MTNDPWAKAPFPWIGGKSRAAAVVWDALGDVHSYVEPFGGSLAVLLKRPHLPNRPYFSETVNDADGLLCNAWRAIQLHPDATAEAASWPVSEADIHARHLALVRWRAARELEHLMGDPAWCDVQMAGWWLYGLSCWIAMGWCAGTDPWTADADGRIYKQAKPQRGVARAQGIWRGLPHLSSNGQGVEHAGLREPGICRGLPHLGNDGQGVNNPGLREPALDSQGLDHVAELLDASLPPEGYHSITMPKLRAWFAALSARLRHVRIVHGDWRRVLTPSVVRNLSMRCKANAFAGVFLDPPYAVAAGRDPACYTHDSEGLSAAVAAWALEHGSRPDYRIVLAGFDGEHGDAFLAADWREVRWYTKGFLTGGYANQGSQAERERLWISPACLGVGLP